MGKKREPAKSRMVFREHWILLTEGRALCLLEIVAFSWLLWGLNFGEASSEFSLTEKLMYDIPLGGLCALGIWTFKKLLWQRCFGKLVLGEDYISFHCFPLPPKTLKIEDCRYIGIADFRKHNRAEKLEKKDLFLNPTCVAIYFSAEPYPAEYDGLVDELKCKPGFIKFLYSDCLAEAVMQRWPTKSGAVARFYTTRSFQISQYAANQKRKRKRKNRKK